MSREKLDSCSITEEQGVGGALKGARDGTDCRVRAVVPGRGEQGPGSCSLPSRAGREVGLRSGEVLGVGVGGRSDTEWRADCSSLDGGPPRPRGSEGSVPRSRPDWVLRSEPRVGRDPW